MGTETRKPRTYGHGLSERPENPTRCVESVTDSSGWHSYQCSRRRGFGPDGLYCKTHNPVARKAKADAKHATWQAEQDARYSRETAARDAIRYVRELAAKGDALAASIVARLG